MGFNIHEKKTKKSASNCNTHLSEVCRKLNRSNYTHLFTQDLRMQDPKPHTAGARNVMLVKNKKLICHLYSNKTRSATRIFELRSLNLNLQAMVNTLKFTICHLAPFVTAYKRKASTPDFAII